jgi:hypothetical protein
MSTKYGKFQTSECSELFLTYSIKWNQIKKILNVLGETDESYGLVKFYFTESYKQDYEEEGYEEETGIRFEDDEELQNLIEKDVIVYLDFLRNIVG